MSQVSLEIEPRNLDLPPGIYETTRLGTMLSKDGDSFVMYLGLDHDRVRQLKERSLDENDVEIQHNTSDRQRFGEGSYEEWFSKNRTPFCLVHGKSGALAALVWFGPKPLGRKSLKHLSAEELAQDERVLDHGDWHTIVYRAYNPFRGKGLMKTFLKTAMDIYRTKYPSSKIWAGVFAENPASIGLVTSLGFKKSDQLSNPELDETILTWEE